MNIAGKVKELRKNADLTQITLAKRVGVGLRFVREVEQGKSTIRLDKLNKVLEFFGHHLEVKRDEPKNTEAG